MQNTDLKSRLDKFVRRFDAARPDERLRMRGEVQGIIRGLKAQHLQVPGSLQRIQHNLEQDAFDDMFDNMPV